MFPWIYILYIPFAALALGIVIGIIYRRVSARCTCKDQMTGKTVIITGANSGIGFSTAREIAARGARVILACRSKEKAEKARESIIEATNNQDVLVKLVDLTSFNSIRSFCKDVLDTETRLDVLINNAGDWSRERRVTAEGYEHTAVTNHHGHFLMTMLLLNLMKKSAPSRIINVSSVAHEFYHLDLDDLHFKKRNFGSWAAYCQSKLCNVLFTKELSHRLTGSGVTANCLHPGNIGTSFPARAGGGHLNLFTFMHLVYVICGKSVDLGAQTTIHLAISSKVAKTTGEYFVDCKIAECSKKSRDPGLAKKLWEITEEEVGLLEDEITI